VRRPSRFNACAVHQAVEVLPFVPVVATTESFSLGSSKKVAAICPVAAFIEVSVAMRASSKPNASTSASSTRQVDAPAASAGADEAAAVVRVARPGDEAVARLDGAAVGAQRAGDPGLEPAAGGGRRFQARERHVQ
jgi:hypothetical protein